jgi:hypothetical protein
MPSSTGAIALAQITGTAFLTEMDRIASGFLDQHPRVSHLLSLYA